MQLPLEGGGDPLLPRVLIVEDHRAVGEGFVLVLGRAGIEVLGLALTAAQALEMAKDLRPAVVLLDHHLPDGTGPQVATAIRDLDPKIQVVILTGSAERQDMLEAIEAGACGYLLKTDSVETIVDAVWRAASGEFLIAPDLIGELLRDRTRRDRERGEADRVMASLTPREHETLEIMGRGLDNKSIAQELSLSLHTVRMHVQNVLEKLGAHSKLEAVTKAAKLGILEQRQQ